jgi:hypothetical protein
MKSGGNGAGVVFYADSESVVRSVKIVIHVKEMTTKSSKIGKNHMSVRRSPEVTKRAGFRNIGINRML